MDFNSDSIYFGNDGGFFKFAPAVSLSDNSIALDRRGKYICE